LIRIKDKDHRAGKYFAPRVPRKSKGGMPVEARRRA
jgi:hypothetical protein